ncbi:MAG TPA: PAS domain S-box protein, partial [Geobacterales bacterium]|nr:PAS domain S-box protein [Geobacterales bacterium]
LRESEELLRAIIEHAPVPILLFREDRKILLINPALTKLTGYTASDIPTRDEWEAWAYRENAPSVKKEVREVFEQGIPTDRGALWVYTKSGEKRLWTIKTAPAGCDASGKRLMVTVGLDITERKKSEDALASALRLEAVGKLAGGVAHDFNNLLAVITGNLELAQDRISDETIRDPIRRALNAGEKGSDLNRRLLSLARKRTLKPEHLNLNTRVEDITKLLEATLSEHIEVATELSADLWMTLADPGEIDSAILNIAANARDAMPGGGRLRISTGNVTVDASAAARLHPDSRPGDYVQLIIADNGVGMSKDVLRKAIEPFFTTKEPGAGTGLGLASVASFARHTGGFAAVESASGCGCAVSLFLPRSVEAPPAPKIVEDRLPLGDGELVLVVEDDDQVREITLKRIESLGYSVTEARTGAEAVQQLKSEEPVQIVLSDVVMPGAMTGYDVARWVASNKPEINVILCSGYNEEDPRGDSQSSIRGIVVLGKPYSRAQLARALSDAVSPPKILQSEWIKGEDTDGF